MLPVPADQEILTLGEGGTPLLPATRLAGHCGSQRVWIKDESQNPTGSFKARGMAVAAAALAQISWSQKIGNAFRG